MRRDYDYTGSSSTSNVSVTWTTRMRRIHRSYASCGWWGVLDALGHQLKLPRWLMRPICDRYDIAAGIPREDLIAMDYDGRAPWWLRR